MTQKTPTSLRILRNNPGHRPLPASEPKPAGSGRMPADLPAEARPYWRRLAPRLRAVGLLTPLDTVTLAELSLCLARTAEAEKDVSVRGLLVDGERGQVKNPSVQIARDYRAQALRLMSKFGMTPSDRAGLSVDASDPDPFADFLNRSGAK